MYAVSKEHKGSKILAKTRRAAIPQKLDALDTSPRDNNNGSRKDFNGFHSNEYFGSSNPRPVFHINGRKTYNHRNQSESISAQHQEIVKYIHESWKCVKRDLESSGGRHSISGDYKNAVKVPQICYYKLDKSSHLPKFEPFDLESFWGQRIYQNITQSA